MTHTLYLQPTNIQQVATDDTTIEWRNLSRIIGELLRPKGRSFLIHQYQSSYQLIFD